ncbi:MAG: sulfatase [Planctomycetaceae bacterium]|nr:sulfatase [Planctomycetaceae bacterium]
MLRLLFSTMLLALTAVSAHAAEAKPNVLMIAVDDLNDWVGPLKGHPQVRTPHMDRLAARGTVFTNAHCQAPLCNPSRSSLLTGLRPSTTGIYCLQPGMRQVEATKSVVTLPQHFGRNGYHTSVFGKIYHDGSIAPKDRAAEVTVWGAAPGMTKPKERLSKGPWQHPAMDWGVFPEHDEDQADWKIADAAIAQLQALPKDRPFFLAAGFRLPHVPCFASQKWFDLYPSDSLQMPPVLDDDRDDVPDFAWYLHWKLPEPRLSALQKADDWRPLVRSYLASIAFMDSQIGRVLEALDQSGRANDTIVVLWSDHGWHLGEKGISGKNTLWERSTRVPLIFAGPGVAEGARCAQPAELLDLYPTLIELCGLPSVSGLEGHSLKPQLTDAAAKRPWPAITTHNQNNHAVRTERHRYIRYADGSEEFYDLVQDPNEWTNLAKRPEFATLIRDHAAWLPKVNAAPVPGSAHRLLVQDNGRWMWEGQPIVPSELER